MDTRIGLNEVQGSAQPTGKKRPVKSKNKLMNIEHPPAMHSVLGWY
jgi:hypothetical protein